MGELLFEGRSSVGPSVYSVRTTATAAVLRDSHVKTLYLLLALTAGAAASAADAQTWNRLGNDGGQVDHLLADPTQPGRVYVTSAGIALSDDAGRHWRPANAGLDSEARAVVVGLVADADQPGRLYLLDGAGRLMRSDNGAQSWLATGYSLILGAAPFGRGRLPMADVPGSSTSLLLVQSNAVYKSTDSGATFTPIIQLGWDGRPVTTIAVDPANPQHILVGTDVSSQSIFGATLLRSTNGGASFNTVSGDPGIGAGTSIAFVPGGPILAVLNGRVHVSSNGGASWQSSGVVANRIAVSPSPPYEAVAMTATSCRRSTDFLAGSTACDAGLPTDATFVRFTDLAVAADGPNAFRAVATASVIGTRAWQSTEAGWATSNAGLSSRHMRGLALVPGDANSLLAGYWIETAYETTPLFMTRNRGVQWSSALDDRAKYIRTLAVDPTTATQASTTTVYAGGLSLYVSGQPTRASVYRSDDGGQNWTVLEQGLPAGSLPGSAQRSLIRNLLVDPRSCATPPAVGRCRNGPLQRVFALASTEGWRVLRSDARGGNWVSGDAEGSGLPRLTDDGNAYEAIYPVDIEVAASGNVYLSTLHVAEADDGSPVQPVMASGVFLSTDGGLHWQQRSTGLPLLPGATQSYPDVPAIVAHPRRPDVLWAAVGQYLGPSRIYKTLDGGANWFATSPVLSDCWVRDLQVDLSAPDVVYAAGTGVGLTSACILRSEDGGSSWQRVGDPLPFGVINEVRWNEHDQARLVVSTEQGVWEGLVAPDKIFIGRFDD